jgi:hypothetical protein
MRVAQLWRPLLIEDAKLNIKGTTPWNNQVITKFIAKARAFCFWSAQYHAPSSTGQNQCEALVHRF